MRESTRAWLVGVTVLITTLYIMHTHHKWDAAWGSIPVWVYSVIGGALIWWALGKLYWFAHPYRSTGLIMLLVPALGAMLCIFLGLRYTEPREEDAWQTDTRGRPVYAYNYANTRSGRMYYSWQEADTESSDSVGATDTGDIDIGDGEGAAVIVVVLLVIALVAASAFVPHFWVFACLVLTTVLFRIAWREHQLE